MKKKNNSSVIHFLYHEQLFFYDIKISTAKRLLLINEKKK